MLAKIENDNGFILLFKESEIKQCAWRMFEINAKLTEKDCPSIYRKFQNHKFSHPNGLSLNIRWYLN